MFTIYGNDMSNRSLASGDESFNTIIIIIII